MRMRMNMEELIEQCEGKKWWVNRIAIIPTGYTYDIGKKKIQTSAEQELCLWPRQGCVGAHCGLPMVIIHLQLNPEHWWVSGPSTE